MGASAIGKIRDKIYMVSWTDQVSIQDPTTFTTTTFYVCDDCGEGYLAPRYYTFDVDACGGGYDPGMHMTCTGNICPECAGPYVDPDDEHDPRRPAS